MRGKREERLPDYLAPLIGQVQFIGRGARVNLFSCAQDGFERNVFVTMLSILILALVDGYSVDPCPEARFKTEARQAPVGLEEHNLEHILCSSAVPNSIIDQVVNAILILLVYGLKCSFVTGLDCLNQSTLVNSRLLVPYTH